MVITSPRIPKKVSIKFNLILRNLSFLKEKKLFFPRFKIDLFKSNLFNLDYFQYKNPKKDLVIQKVDEINSLFGNNSIIFASNGIKKDWKMKTEKRSNRYTTNYNEILQVN